MSVKNDREVSLGLKKYEGVNYTESCDVELRLEKARIVDYPCQVLQYLT